MHIICPVHLQYIYHIYIFFAAAQNVMFYIDIIISPSAVTKHRIPTKDHKVFILLSQVTVSNLPLKVNQNRNLCTETSENASLTRKRNVTKRKPHKS